MTDLLLMIIVISCSPWKQCEKVILYYIIFCCYDELWWSYSTHLLSCSYLVASVCPDRNIYAVNNVDTETTRVSRPELFHLYHSLSSHIIVWCPSQIGWTDHCSSELHLHSAETDPDRRAGKWTGSSILFNDTVTARTAADRYAVCRRNQRSDLSVIGMCLY